MGHTRSMLLSLALSAAAYHQGLRLAGRPAVATAPRLQHSCVRCELPQDDKLVKKDVDVSEAAAATREILRSDPAVWDVPTPVDEPEGYGEYYDLTTDPWQMNNTARALSPAKRRRLRARLDELRACAGQVGCA